MLQQNLNKVNRDFVPSEDVLLMSYFSQFP